jgi:hypothetical protein
MLTAIQTGIDHMTVHRGAVFGKSLGLIVAVSWMGVFRVEAGVPAESLYSALIGENCRTVKQDTETASSVTECAGVGGFRLLVIHDDARSSVTVVTAEGKRFPLEYWNVVTHAFSELGTKAEWRVLGDRGKVAPIALIIRVTYDDQENIAAPSKRSVLAVAKITPESICVVQMVQNAQQANESARKSADTAATRPCLPPLP